MSEQSENLERVSARIGGVIVEFFESRKPGDRFHMGTLADFVIEKVGGAPDSPSRIMRALRRERVIGYRVVSRKDSLYEIEAPAPADLE